MTDREMREDNGVPATRVIVRREPLVEKSCPVCGRAFRGLGRRVYCSPTCRNSADYRRHQEERKSRRRSRYREQQADAEDTTPPWLDEGAYVAAMVPCDGNPTHHGPDAFQIHLLKAHRNGQDARRLWDRFCSIRPAYWAPTYPWEAV